MQNNNLYGQYGGGGMDKGFSAMIQKFNEFRQSFQGDPQQVVQQMLATGQMSQQQFNQLRGMAQWITGILPGNK